MEIDLKLTKNELALLGELLGTKWYNKRISRTWNSLHDQFYEHRVTFKIPKYKTDAFDYTLTSLKSKVKEAQGRNK